MLSPRNGMTNKHKDMQGGQTNNILKSSRYQLYLDNTLCSNHPPMSMTSKTSWIMFNNTKHAYLGVNEIGHLHSRFRQQRSHMEYTSLETSVEGCRQTQDMEEYDPSPSRWESQACMQHSGPWYVLCGGFTFGQDKVPTGHFPSYLRTTKSLGIGFFNEKLRMEFGTWECSVHPKT